MRTFHAFVRGDIVEVEDIVVTECASAIMFKSVCDAVTLFTLRFIDCTVFTSHFIARDTLVGASITRNKAIEIAFRTAAVR